MKVAAFFHLPLEIFQAHKRIGNPFINTQASLVAQLIKNPPAMQETLGSIPGEGDRLPTPVFLGFPGGSAGKESAHSAGDLGLIPGLGRSPGEGNDYPLQYSGLENSTNYTWSCKESDMTERLSLS